MIEEEVLISVDLVSQQSLIKVEHKKFNLNTDQSIAAKNIISSMGDKNFKRFLIDGVTGSGKTEVYFEAIEEALKRNKQSLILLPEISLTESLFERIKIRFGF